MEQQKNHRHNNNPQTQIHQDIVILESSKRDQKEEEKEKIEFVTKLGTRILVSLGPSTSGVERISIAINDNSVASKETGNSIEMNILPDKSVSLETRMNLKLKAKNIEIEAENDLLIKSGSIMTIKSSLIKIN